jgi:hypothetical protein
MNIINKVIVPRTVYHVLSYEAVVAIIFALYDKWLTTFFIAWIMVLTFCLFKAVRTWSSRGSGTDAKTGWAFGIIACVFMVFFSVMLMRMDWSPGIMQSLQQDIRQHQQTTTVTTTQTVTETTSPSY